MKILKTTGKSIDAILFKVPALLIISVLDIEIRAISTISIVESIGIFLQSVSFRRYWCPSEHSIGSVIFITFS